MSEIKRIDGFACDGCYSYRSEKINTRCYEDEVHYCKSLYTTQVQIGQGTGSITFTHPIIYKPEERLHNCPLK